MAKPYPILPASVLDELNDLNGALGAYDVLITAWINQTLTEGPAGDPKHFAAGCQFLLRPILEGFQSIESQASAFREMGVVCFCQLAEPDQEKP
jgi:hypothetical protein